MRRLLGNEIRRFAQLRRGGGREVQDGEITIGGGQEWCRFRELARQVQDGRHSLAHCFLRLSIAEFPSYQHAGHDSIPWTTLAPIILQGQVLAQQHWPEEYPCTEWQAAGLFAKDPWARTIVRRREDKKRHTRPTKPAPPRPNNDNQPERT